MPSPILQAIKQISDEKNISAEAVIETIEAALAAAYRKDFGKKKDQNIKVVFDPETGDFDVFDVKTVVEDMELPSEEEAMEEEKPVLKRETEGQTTTEAAVGEGGAPAEEEKKFNPKTEMMISEARATVKPDAQIGDELRIQLEVPAAFGRMAAQTAKQVIIQNLREAERTKLFNEYKGREGELVNATVQRREGRFVLVDIGQVTGILPPEDQIPTERYGSGDRLKVFITAVKLTTRGPEVVVSRTHPDIVRRLFTLEIPEVASGVVEIHAIAREAGSRAKVAVSSTQDNVDPIGSCIGQRGTRIQTVIGELGGEKIDIIQYDPDPVKFIVNALSPAKVSDITLRPDENTADVLVNEDQLSLAIGKGGQNVRLASRLTGWKLNIRGTDGTTSSSEEEAAASAAASGSMAEEPPPEQLSADGASTTL